MHIPACPTQEAPILTFQEALTPHNRDYDPSRWLYVPDFYAEYRYILGTRGSRPLICIGVNPSTAVPGALDNTLKSVERIALGNGFDSFIMFNVYAQRATRPDDMDRALNAALHRENLTAFRYVLDRAGPAPAVWAAWGAVIEKRPYLPRCVYDMAQLGRAYGARWLRVGKLSVRGHPHHPLYLRRDEPVQDFDLDAYLTSMGVPLPD